MNFLSHLSDYLLYGVLALCGLAGLYVVVMSLLVQRQRHRMLCYAEFVRETCLPDHTRLPALIRRYLQQEIDAYNALRRGWPWRLLWREARLGTLLQVPFPAGLRDAARKRPGELRTKHDAPGEANTAEQRRAADAARPGSGRHRRNRRRNRAPRKALDAQG